MKIVLSLRTMILLLALFFIANNSFSQKSKCESKGKDFEIVIGVPGVQQNQIGDLKYDLQKIYGIFNVVYCPKHDLFMIYSKEKIIYETGDERTNGIKASEIVNRIQEFTGLTAFIKDMVAEQFYDDCQNLIKTY